MRSYRYSYDMKLVQPQMMSVRHRREAYQAGTEMEYVNPIQPCNVSSWYTHEIHHVSTAMIAVT